MTFKKIVDLCVKHGFFYKYQHPKLKRQVFRIQSTGLFLQQNLHQEWLNDMIINKDFSCFMTGRDFCDAYTYGKSACLDLLPFAVAQIVDQNLDSDELKDSFDKYDRVDFNDFCESNRIYKCSVFVGPTNATPFFHQWQRQRKMWWRKFSASPGRYTLTDIKTDDSNSQTVHIQASYPWGDQLVETLKLESHHEQLTTQDLTVRDGRKQVTAHSVTSEIRSELMFLNTISDAYDEPIFQGNPRPMMRLHRKLAPYKISFAIPTSQKSVVDELKDLALYLCRQLRSDNVACLLSPVSYKTSLESQWKQYDQIGIPYNVLLNEKTLKDGVVLLRSRDTTLKEQVHVSNLRNHVEQLFKNY